VHFTGKAEEHFKTARLSLPRLTSAAKNTPKRDSDKAATWKAWGPMLPRSPGNTE